jgi:hypothetical protein
VLNRAAAPRPLGPPGPHAWRPGFVANAAPSRRGTSGNSQKKGAGIAMPAPWMNHADASRAASSPLRVCPKSPAVVIHAHCRKKPTDRSVEQYPMNRLSRLLSRKM